MNRKNNFKKETNKKIVWVEIALLVVAIFSFAYILRESSEKSEIVANGRGNLFLSILGAIGKIIFSGIPSVQALETSDLQAGTYTCLKDKNGSICQEYLASECNSKCQGECIQTPATQVSACKIGTCYDENLGTCAVNSPKDVCENNNGKWYDDKFGNVDVCRQGCCAVGTRTFMSTEQQCRKTSSLLGFTIDFKGNIRSEIDCLNLAETQERGACVYQGDEKTCKFTTKPDCLRTKGEFYSNTLCSNPDLNTTCIKQKSTGCFAGDDGVYWVDSCGNKENIYDANKDKSFNNGLILEKNQSCTLNFLTNKLTCGNCNRFLGSTCSANSEGTNPKFICKDLSCVDENGKKRQNGESWCEYQSSIGVDSGVNGLKRSVDVPGSRHFRVTCFDGEIKTEPCQDYRNEICIESRTPVENGKTFSTAACKMNRWQQCIGYNYVKGKMDECTKNNDCFVKKVEISKFKFDVCAPRYPPGFEFVDGESTGQSFCDIGSQKCTMIYVKQLSGWKCKVNCACGKQGFAEQMNDLCISLGDCGAKVNIAGDLTENYNVKKTPKLSTSYLTALKKYSSYGNSPNDYVDAEGYPLEFIGEDETSAQSGGMMKSLMGAVPGLAGIGFSMISQKVAFFKPGAAGAALGNGIAAGLSLLAIAYTVYGFASQGDWLMAGVVVGIAVAATVVTAIVTQTTMASAFGSMAGFMAAAGTILPIVGIVVAVAVILFQLVFGLGKTAKVIVEFQCNPWQAPNGGDKCSQCGKDGFKCSKYACQSLGKTCELINENSGDEQCINIAPNDVAAPIIKPLRLLSNYSYEENDNGYSIKSNEDDKCIKAYQSLKFGISLDEPGQCKVDAEHKTNFEEMSDYFGGRSLYLINHTQEIIIPDLDAIGGNKYNPESKVDFNLYVRCEDKSGNSNINEYLINFCVKPGDDISPPVVTGRNPFNENVRFNSEKLNASVFTNEPSDCKWSLQDKEYGLMENQMSCKNKFEERELLGWKCSSEFPVGTNQSKIYVRCKDQPWILEGEDGQNRIVGDNINMSEYQLDEPLTQEERDALTDTGTAEITNKKRNVMTQSYEFLIKKTNSELRIDYVKPNNQTIKSGQEPISITLEAKTSGGLDGKALCKFGSGNNSLIDFFETGTTLHKQVFQSFLAGRKIIDVRCEDIVGNTADATADFTLELDTTPPEVTRVYNSNNQLYVITNEYSSCKTSKDPILGCGFDWTNGTFMAGEQIVHISEFNNIGKTYVKCKDNYGKVPDGCSVLIKGAGEL
jgi:hypothetical protein